MRRRVNHHLHLHCRRFWFRSPPEWRRWRLSTAGLSLCSLSLSLPISLQISLSI
ncbi:hypothetical protein HanRHA438_Chr16g0736491 [Helianthus annuus]|nr:hypothetical protein HanHA89_Chr16g0640391 [Helianthus annuus]KAJ0643166.1 hypothetical protein HanOQP8_Chr16g0597631 [Helianthus annuus]KAJ0819291.1 hypothetical protein HanPSC8_Chr16g0694421 [Helianthus annuus]KAJ0833783.1 hypothetical protein HanRHA438_Chr16g0736491 [Helianthus annuus]